MRNKQLIMILASLLLSSCANNSGESIQIEPLHNLPETLFADKQVTLAEQEQALSDLINNDELHRLISLALNNNVELKSQQYALEIQRLNALNSGSALWPTLDATFSTRRAEAASSDTVTSSNTAGLDLRYEIDIWQKLSASEQQANLEYLSGVANFRQSQRTLVKNVMLAWLDVIEAKQVQRLLESRVSNSKQNLDIIENGYQQGLNEALDVYLARNEYSSEQSRLAQQVFVTQASVRNLERLLGRYPSNQLEINSSLPNPISEVQLALPSEVVKQNPQIQAKWVAMLARDAGLAFAHKQRFPSLVLSASVNDSTEKVQDLFSGGLGWSLLGNLTAPIFEAGRLRNNQAIAENRLRQAEQDYLSQVLTTFEQIENSLTAEETLKARYEATLAAEKNATAAEKLSFEKYQNGLVSYTTVLDSQSRAFDARSSRIQLAKQLVTNQIQLQFAVGGKLTPLIPEFSEGRDLNND